jgi:predicted transcriptional regulator
MSELYLVLRHRLRSVAEWVQLGSKEMRAARRTQGLSLEAVARQLHVSSKTYERYEKQGRVPRHMLGTYAEIVDLEIEEPTRTRVTVDGEAHDPDALRQVLAELADVRQSVERLSDLLEEQRAPRTQRRRAST